MRIESHGCWLFHEYSCWKPHYFEESGEVQKYFTPVENLDTLHNMQYVRFHITYPSTYIIIGSWLVAIPDAQVCSFYICG